jgi:hypothetical protein
MKKIIIMTLVSSLGLLVGCSKGKTDHAPTLTLKTEPLEEEFKGVYQAIFAPLNKNFSGHLNGSLTILKENDDFIANIRFSGGPKSVLHTQSIHIGTRCPSLDDDLNNDGIIDGEEGALVYKEIILPLDEDLNSQWLGLGTYPASDEFGSYLWSRSASFKKILKDLYEEDINQKDDLIKLSDTKAFTLNGNVVVISGIPTSQELPETVIGRGRLTKHQSLPIACGVIRKLTHVPGVIDTDSTGIIYPGGDTIGGSSGVDDGAIFESYDTTGNYGEEDSSVSDNSTEFDFEESP